MQTLPPLLLGKTGDSATHVAGSPDHKPGQLLTGDWLRSPGLALNFSWSCSAYTFLTAGLNGTLASTPHSSCSSAISLFPRGHSAGGGVRVLEPR